MPRPPRILILPAAAIIILALCAWRLANPPNNFGQLELPEDRRPAPSFQLYDQDSTLVNLDAYLHRHQIVLVFFDGQAGPDASDVLTTLREFHPALKREGILVLGVSTALPQEIRNMAAQPYPFRILCDAAATDRQSVHRLWGCFVPPPSLDKPAGTRPAVFIIDRTGLVSWEGDAPRPESHPRQLINKLLGG